MDSNSSSITEVLKLVTLVENLDTIFHKKNRRISWGITTSLSTEEDLYRPTMSKMKNANISARTKIGQCSSFSCPEM